MAGGSLLLVDDDRHVLDSMASWLREEHRYEVQTAGGVVETLELVARQRFDVALVDVRLQDGDGFDLLAHFTECCPQTAVIMITGYGTVDTAVDAMRSGAFDFLTKPLIDEELEIAIGRAFSHRQVLQENSSLKAQLEERFGMDNIVGRDHQMQRVFDVIESVADTRATVLITGESGTGKSLIARAIHRRSGRNDRPFVEIACGALPESLLESELFGHVAGAFTGATTEKVGRFLQADGGTIFLDEIGTASPAMQVKLLRVLQELEFEQVGGTKTFKVDTRVILATNEDLTQAVAEGRFRQDLFYRVNVINLRLPAIRERLADVPLLAGHFLQKICNELGKPMPEFSADAMAAMQRYHWPGNVRELQNVVERAVLLGKGSQIGLEDLPAEMLGGAPVAIAGNVEGRQSLKDAMEGPERRIILQALEEHNWCRNATAAALDINRTTLYKKMIRLGLLQRQTSEA